MVVPVRISIPRADSTLLAMADSRGSSSGMIRGARSSRIQRSFWPATAAFARHPLPSRCAPRPAAAPGLALELGACERV